MLENSGLSEATNIKIVDTLPMGAIFLEASSGCVHSNGNITCILEKLHVNSSQTFYISVKVNSSARWNFDNSAFVSSANADPDLLDNATVHHSRITHSLVIYANGFESGAGNRWSSTTTSMTPANNNNFLGEFGNDTVRLTLPEIPTHTKVLVEFDLYLIHSWDGNTVTSTGQYGQIYVIGPDYWTLSIPGQCNLLHTTFSNWEGQFQLFPGNLPGQAFPAFSGSKSVNSLGYKFVGVSRDSVYHLSFTIPHTGEVLELDFSASGLQEITDESWGLDNIVVSINNDYTVALPLLTR